MPNVPCMIYDMVMVNVLMSVWMDDVILSDTVSQAVVIAPGQGTCDKRCPIIEAAYRLSSNAFLCVWIL